MVRHYGTLQILTRTRSRNLFLPEKQTQTGSLEKNEVINNLVFVPSFNPNYLWNDFETLQVERTKQGRLCCCVDESAARKISDCVKIEDPSKTVILEANAGQGLITKYLLSRGVSKINVFDYQPTQEIIQLASENNSKVEIIPANLFRLFSTFQNVHPGVEELSTDPILENKEELKVKIVGIARKSNYLSYLARKLVKLNEIETNETYDDMDQYLVVPPKVYFGILTNNSYTKLPLVKFYNHLLFKSLMEFEVLEELPFKSHTGLHATNGGDNLLRLVRIFKRKSTFEQFTPKELAHLGPFLTYLATSKKNKIIPLIENLSPGSGEELIRQGLNLRTEIQEFSINDVITLFRYFNELPNAKDGLVALRNPEKED